jgi:hypothetical protein
MLSRTVPPANSASATSRPSASESVEDETEESRSGDSSESEAIERECSTLRFGERECFRSVRKTAQNAPAVRVAQRVVHLQLDIRIDFLALVLLLARQAADVALLVVLVAVTHRVVLVLRVVLV